MKAIIGTGEPPPRTHGVGRPRGGIYIEFADAVSKATGWIHLSGPTRGSLTTYATRMRKEFGFETAIRAPKGETPKLYARVKPPVVG